MKSWNTRITRVVFDFADGASCLFFETFLLVAYASITLLNVAS